MHVVQWRGYFSARALFYKKINGRIGYNNYLWENRIIGSSMNMLLGSSYVFRLQSRKNKLRTLHASSDADCGFIPSTPSLRRRHFSYIKLGQSLLRKAEPMQTVYALGAVQHSLYRLLTYQPTFICYLQLKKFMFFFKHHQASMLHKGAAATALIFFRELGQAAVKYLRQLYFSVNIMHGQMSGYLRNKEFKHYYDTVLSIIQDATLRGQRVSSAKLFASLSYLANTVVLTRSLTMQKFNECGGDYEMFKSYKKTYVSFLRVRIANVNALFTSLWGRRHRSRIRWERSSAVTAFNRKKRIYFYTKVLPRLKHRLRRRKHHST